MEATKSYSFEFNQRIQWHVLHLPEGSSSSSPRKACARAPFSVRAEARSGFPPFQVGVAPLSTKEIKRSLIDFQLSLEGNRRYISWAAVSTPPSFNKDEPPNEQREWTCLQEGVHKEGMRGYQASMPADLYKPPSS